MNIVASQTATIAALLTSPGFKEQLAMALPKHMDANKVARIALTEVRKSPALASCSLSSFQAALMTASQIGLEIGSGFGQAYLVPYGKECQLIVGYRGMIQLAHRSGMVKNIHADVVYKDDFFDCQNGIELVFKHVRNQHVEKKREDIILSYAYIHLMSGGFEYVICDKHDLARIKAISRSKNIWSEHFEEMAKKTAIRRLFKMMPASSEITHILSQEDQREYSAEKEYAQVFSPDVLDDETAEQTTTNMLAEEISNKGE